MTTAEQLREKILELETKILSSHPQIPVLLRTIHQTLKADPAIVTFLKAEEIGTIVRGLKKQTNTEIAVSASKSGNGKSLKNIGIADL